MKRILLASAFAIALLSPAFASGAHHSPMPPPLDCHGNFECMHPGYAAARANLSTISTWWGSGSGFSCKSGEHRLPDVPGHAPACAPSE